MSTTESIRILKRMDQLIHTKSTGAPEDFACLLSVSERTLYNYLSVMKELGAPIRYSRYFESYTYNEEGRFVLEFEKPEELKYAL